MNVTAEIPAITGPRLRSSWRDLLVGQKHRLFITVCYEPHAPNRDKVERDLRNLAARINDEFLGRRWTKQPSNTYMHGIFVVEQATHNAHSHGCVTPPSGVSDHDFKVAAIVHWKDVTHGLGSIQIGPNNLFATANYITKELKHANDQGNVILIPR